MKRARPATARPRRLHDAGADDAGQLKSRDMNGGGGLRRRSRRQLSVQSSSAPPPLDGCVICLSGFPPSAKDHLHSLVQSLGGTYDRALATDRVTHLVSASASGEKYREAVRCAGIEVVTESWVEACDREGARVDEGGHRLEQCGGGGGGQADAHSPRPREDPREAVSSRLETELDELLPDATYGSSSPFGPVFSSCLFHLVGFFEDEDGVNDKSPAYPPVPYGPDADGRSKRIEGRSSQTLQRRGSQQLRRRGSVDRNVDAGTPAHSDLCCQTHAVESAAEQTPPSSPVARKLRRLLRLGRGTLLWSLSEDATHLVVAESCPSALRREAIDASLRMPGSGLRCVGPSWIVASARAGRMADELEHIPRAFAAAAAPTNAGRDGDRSEVAARRKGGKFGVVDDASSPKKDEKRRKAAICSPASAKKQQTLPKMLSQRQQTQPNNQEKQKQRRQQQREETQEVLETMPPPSVTQMMLPPMPTSPGGRSAKTLGSEVQGSVAASLRGGAPLPESRAKSKEEPLIFRGAVFVLGPLTAPPSSDDTDTDDDCIDYGPASALEELVVRHGGRMLDHDAADGLLAQKARGDTIEDWRACYVLSAYEISDEDVGREHSPLLAELLDANAVRPVHATPLWLRTCDEEGTEVPPDFLPSLFVPPSRPFRRLPPSLSKSTSNAKFTVSGFEGSERSGLTQLLAAMGGRVTANMKKDHTIVVCNGTRTPKYHRAMEWGLTVVMGWGWPLKVAREGYTKGCEEEFSPNAVTTGTRTDELESRGVVAEALPQSVDGAEAAAASSSATITPKAKGAGASARPSVDGKSGASAPSEADEGGAGGGDGGGQTQQMWSALDRLGRGPSPPPPDEAPPPLPPAAAGRRAKRAAIGSKEGGTKKSSARGGSARKAGGEEDDGSAVAMPPPRKRLRPSTVGDGAGDKDGGGTTNNKVKGGGGLNLGLSLGLRRKQRRDRRALRRSASAPTTGAAAPARARVSPDAPADGSAGTEEEEEAEGASSAAAASHSANGGEAEERERAAKDGEVEEGEDDSAEDDDDDPLFRPSSASRSRDGFASNGGGGEHGEEEGPEESQMLWYGGATQR